MIPNADDDIIIKGKVPRSLKLTQLLVMSPWWIYYFMPCHIDLHVATAIDNVVPNASRYYLFFHKPLRRDLTLLKARRQHRQQVYHVHY